MDFIAFLIGLGLGLSVVFSVWRISENVRKIREHFDRVDRLVAEAGKPPKVTP